MAYGDVPWHIPWHTVMSRGIEMTGAVVELAYIQNLGSIAGMGGGVIRNFRVWGLIRRFRVSKLKIQPHYDQRSGRISLNPKFGVDRWHGGLLETLGFRN